MARALPADLEPASDLLECLGGIGDDPLHEDDPVTLGQGARELGQLPAEQIGELPFGQRLVRPVPRRGQEVSQAGVAVRPDRLIDRHLPASETGVHLDHVGIGRHD